jgi:predicted nucleic acid-binding protein
MKVLTYIDSGVLISAVCGDGNIAKKALDYLDDPDREFASSILVKLEVLPKAIYNKSEESLSFYEWFFSNVTTFSETCDAHIQGAFLEAKTHGISGIDALHISTAKGLNALDFITNEKPSKPLFKTGLVNVISIRPLKKPAQAQEE